MSTFDFLTPPALCQIQTVPGHQKDTVTSRPCSDLHLWAGEMFDIYTPHQISQRSPCNFALHPLCICTELDSKGSYGSLSLTGPVSCLARRKTQKERAEQRERGTEEKKKEKSRGCFSRSMVAVIIMLSPCHLQHQSSPLGLLFSLPCHYYYISCFSGATVSEPAVLTATFSHCRHTLLGAASRVRTCQYNGVCILGTKYQPERTQPGFCLWLIIPGRPASPLPVHHQITRVLHLLFLHTLPLCPTATRGWIRSRIVG